MLYMWYSNQLLFFHPIFWCVKTRKISAKKWCFLKRRQGYGIDYAERYRMLGLGWLGWRGRRQNGGSGGSSVVPEDSKGFPSWSQHGCFLKWWYSQDTPKWSFLVGKPHGCWVPPFRKHPYGDRLSFFVFEPLEHLGVPIIQGLKNSCGKRPY